TLMKSGRTQEALAALEPLSQRPDQPEWNIVSLAQTLLAAGRRGEAEALLPRLPSPNFYRGLLLCALGHGDEAVPLLKPVVSVQRDIMLWVFQDTMPRNSPEFQRKLTEWGMSESWQ